MIRLKTYYNVITKIIIVFKVAQDGCKLAVVDVKTVHFIVVPSNQLNLI